MATRAVYLNQEQLLPEERSCEVLSDLFGCPISEGTLEKAVEACHERLAETEAAIKRGIEEARVAHFDETGVNISRGSQWAAAVEPYMRALTVARQAPVPFVAIHPLSALGDLCVMRGLLRRAHEFRQEALAIIAERYLLLDQLSLLRQIGAIPS